MKHRTLIIDDEWAIRALLRSVLEPMGHDIVEAENGVDAERALDRHAFDLIITDLVMPERDGLETIQLVRARYPEMPIVAASTAANHVLLECARVMGARGFLLKPFQARDVRDVLDEIGPLKHGVVRAGESC